jgi:plasmid stabilization system protein ParE
MSNYVLSSKARQEIREIWDFIAQDDLDAADRWTMKLVEAFHLLARNPRIGHARKDLTNLPVLFWPVERYFIIYQPREDGIEIVAVTQGSREISSFLRRQS